MNVCQCKCTSVCLCEQELQELDQSFSERAKTMMDQSVTEVRMRLKWEEERCDIALSKLQGWCDYGHAHTNTHTHTQTKFKELKTG